MQIVENKEAISISNISDMENREEIARGLSRVLADTYCLYLKTQYYHWNVTGKNFHQFHNMFEEQYTSLAKSVDEIAERIRALGYFSPGTMKEFSKITNIKEDESFPKTPAMIKNLLDANEKCMESCLELKKVSESIDDVTADMMTSRMSYHQKISWMLRSSLIEG